MIEQPVTDEQSEAVEVLYLRAILDPLIDRPEDLTIKRSIDEMGVFLEVQAAANDTGKIIGKAGETAKAIRLVLKVFGARQDKRINMKILEPVGGGIRG